MKRTIVVQSIEANLFGQKRATRFDGLASDACRVEVEYRQGDNGPYDPPFLEFVAARSVDEIVMWGSPNEAAGLTPDRSGYVMLTIPPGFDITELFSRHEQEEMCERILKQLIEESEQP